MVWYNENDPKAAAWLRELAAFDLLPEGQVDERSIKQVEPGDIPARSTAHFFAGIGGWERALYLADWPIDREVWTGSCPCQPFSSAGKRLRAADPRHLWPEFLRLIAIRRPPTIFGEQVAGPDGREWLAGVRLDLERLGYAVGAADLGSACVGSPHIRQRLFWVADALCSGRPEGRPDARVRQASRSGIVGRMADANGRDAGDRGSQRGREHGEQSQDGRPRRMVDADRAGLEEQRCSFAETSEYPAVENSSIAGFWTRSDAIRCLDGRWRRVPAGAKPFLQPVAHGIPAGMGDLRVELRSGPFPGFWPITKRLSGRLAVLRGAGNAIVPQVAALFVRAYMEARGIEC